MNNTDKDVIIDAEIVKCVKEALDRNVSGNYIDTTLTKTILFQIDQTENNSREHVKEMVIRILLQFTWTQRLYFIIRSIIMGIIGTIFTTLIVYLIGIVNAIQVAVIGIISFIITLAITRIFDIQITNISRKFVNNLSKFKRLRELVLNHF